MNEESENVIVVDEQYIDPVIFSKLVRSAFEQHPGAIILTTPKGNEKSTNKECEK